jgi:hypothetical protein
MSRASGKWAASRLAMGAACAVGLAGMLAAGCNDESMYAPLTGGPRATPGSGLPGNPGDACSPEASKQSCHGTIGSHNGVTNCFDGVQVCTGGQWSACAQGSLTAAHRRPGLQDEHDGVPLGPAASREGGDKLLWTTTGSCWDTCDPTCMAITDIWPNAWGSSTYTAGACPEGSSVEWRWLTYVTNLPMDTSVQFFVQTPSMAMPLQAAWAGNGDPDVCLIGWPSGCPIDLVALLDGTGANGDAFGSSITVSATLTGAPTVFGWQIRYSCVYNQ